MPLAEKRVCDVLHFLDILDGVTHLDRQDMLHITLAQRLALLDKLSQDYQDILHQRAFVNRAGQYIDLWLSRQVADQIHHTIPTTWIEERSDSTYALQELLVRGYASMAVDGERARCVRQQLRQVWLYDAFHGMKLGLSSDVIQKMMVQRLLQKSERMLRALNHLTRRTWSYRIGFAMPVLLFGIASALRTMGFVSAVLLLFSLPLPLVLVLSGTLGVIAFLSDLGFAEPILIRVKQIGQLLKYFYKTIQTERAWKQGIVLVFFALSSCSFSVLMGGLVVLGVTQMTLFHALPTAFVFTMAVILGVTNTLVNLILMTYALFNQVKLRTQNKGVRRIQPATVQVWSLGACGLITSISSLLVLLRFFAPSLLQQWLPVGLSSLSLVAHTVLFSSLAMLALLVGVLLRCVVFNEQSTPLSVVLREMLLLFASTLVCFSTWRLCVQGGAVLMQVGLPVLTVYALQVLGVMSTFCFVYLMIKRVWSRRPWQGISILFQRAYQESIHNHSSTIGRYMYAVGVGAIYGITVLLTKLCVPCCNASDVVYAWYVLHVKPQLQWVHSFKDMVYALFYLLRWGFYGALSLCYYGEWRPQGLGIALRIHILLFRQGLQRATSSTGKWGYLGICILKCMAGGLVVSVVVAKNLCLHVLRTFAVLFLNYLYVLNACIAALSASFTMALSRQWAILPFSSAGGFISSYAKAADNTDDIALLGKWETAYRLLWPYSPLDSVIATQPQCVESNSILSGCYLTEADFSRVSAQELEEIGVLRTAQGCMH